MKLLLLSGPDKRPGWTTLDANPVHRPDIVRTLPPLALETSSCEKIELSHGIGHFYLWEAKSLLKEMHLALTPNGTLILEQPNLLYAAQVLTGLKEPVEGAAEGQCDMWPLYGDPNHRDPLHGIKWGWTPETLIEALVEAGFERGLISCVPAKYHMPERDFRLEAVK